MLRSQARATERAGAAAFAALLGAVFLASCGTKKSPCASDHCPQGGVRFVFPALGDYTLRLSMSGGAVAQCPAGEAHGLTCGQQDAWLPIEPEQLTATLKARGFRSLRQSFAPAYTCQCSGGDAQAEIQLTPVSLAPFEVNRDYRTGFEADGGLDDFVAMGFPASGELGPTWTVKFYIEGLDTDRPDVYFQNTRLHPIHYDFVRGVLGKAVSTSDFEAATYHGAQRRAMAGSVVFYPDRRTASTALGEVAVAPLTVEFFPEDDLTPAQALRATMLLEERMAFVPLTGGAHRLFYLPAGSIHEAALTTAAVEFSEWSAGYLLREELYAGLTQQLLNAGVAFGTLRIIAPEAIDTSAVSFHDVIVLPRLPNHLPIVGGSITGELQTPLAHVNVAARARGTPNLALTTAATDPRVTSLMDKLVRFEVGTDGFSLREATLAEAEAFWASRSSQPHFVPEADSTTQGLPGFEELSAADAKSVGVKAANLSEMSNLIPARTPPDGFAVPFHAYDTFITTSRTSGALCDAAQTECLADGTRTAAVCAAARGLCLPDGGQPEPFKDLIHRLLGDPTFTTDSRVREAALTVLRSLITNTPVDPSFGSALDARVLQRMGTKKVKLRSSTNAEDLPRFSGAGLYDSYSAESSGAKAASSRIRLVWASVWNWRAFEERAFWNIDQEALRMGVLVNPSYSNEEANGVIITQNLANLATPGMYVNVQLGENLVTNPADGALPEAFSIVPGPTGIQVARQRFSSLSPGRPLMTEEEMRALFTTALTVRDHFAPIYGVPAYDLTLDIEFKLTAKDRALVFKQVRPYYSNEGP